MSIKKCFGALLIFYAVYSNLSYGKQLVIQIESMRLCKCAKNCIMNDYVSAIRRFQNINVVDCSFELTETIKAVKLTITPHRCNSKEALDSCENQNKRTIEDSCFFLNMENTMWSTFTTAFKPPFKCPFEKGRYVGRGAYLAATYPVPLPTSFYKTNLDFYTVGENKYLFTLCIHFKLDNI